MPTPATGLGIVLSVPKGRPAGTLRIDLAGTALALDLANTPASEVRNDTDPASLWLWRLTLANPATVDSLRLTWQGATPVQLRALSLVDERDGASAADIETLGETVRARVKAHSGIELEWEIKRIGVAPTL